MSVSPCGRRFAFTDTDGRIVVVTIPTTSATEVEGGIDVVVLPSTNEIGQPLIGEGDTALVWSPGERYLAIENTARNHFSVISIADLGSADFGAVNVGRIVQATPDRFNSFS